MTHSITITTTTQPPIVIRAYLSDLAMNLKELLSDVKMACQTLEMPQDQQGVLQKVMQWESDFFQTYMIGNYPTDEDRMKASYALCFFHQNMEEIMLKLETRKEKKVEWFKFCNRTKEILTEILPSHLQAEPLLSQYKKRLADASALQEELRLIDELYDKSEQALIDKGNEAINKLRLGRAAFKQELLKLHEERQKSSETIHAEVDALNQQIGGIIQGMEERFEQVRKFGEKMSAQEELLSGFLKDCQHIINKV